jgi:hypothetical protein
MKIQRDCVIAWCLLSCAVALSGCSDGLAKVEGQVLFDGSPVNRGMISLEPTDGKGPTAGSNVENGRYAIERVVPGPKSVRISAVKVVGKQRAYEDENSPEIEITEELLPKKYNDATELKLEVAAPRTQHDFKLESK